MTALKAILLDEIIRNGPMTLAHYMHRALADPQHGYYMQRQPFGVPDDKGGDFITAPEVSQMFGELLGVWVADLWNRMGQPKPFCLAELGPGRGTLMADMLRTASASAGLAEAVEVHFVETSPALQKAQHQAVPNASRHDDVSTLPALPTLLVANEFFDSLPINQFIRSGDGWSQIMVTAQQGKLAFANEKIHGSPFSQALAACLPTPPAEGAIAEGTIVETCPQGEAVMAQLAEHIAAHGGAALLVDYGHADKACGDSFQAMRAHRHVHPLAAPGDADLTAHVNFPLLAHIAAEAGLAAWPIVEQGVFLEALGLNIRAEQLRQANPTQMAQIQSERLRLAAPQEMGSLFKVLGVAHKDMPPLAGFAA